MFIVSLIMTIIGTNRYNYSKSLILNSFNNIY
jgi:hypothetical protein